MKNFYIMLLAVFALHSFAEQTSNPIEIGQKYHCFSCHGKTGVPQTSRYPTLAGQQKDYLVKRLEAFRDGKLESHSIMNNQARSMSDEEIQTIAQYFEDKGFHP